MSGSGPAELPPITLPEFVASHARWRPDVEALVCGDRRVRWAELNQRVNRVANALQGLGIGRGDKVSVLMGNSVEMVEVILGTGKAGAAIVPLSGMLAGESLAAMMGDSGARALIVGAPLHNQILPVADRLTGVGSGARIALGFEAPGWSPYAAWTATASADEPRVAPALTDDFNIIYSSGTTGVPKGIVHTHFARLLFAFGLAVEFRFTPTCRALVTTPLYTNGTWLMLLPALLVGGTVVIMPQFDPKSFLDVVQSERCTHTFMVPTQFTVTMAATDFDRYDLRTMDIMVSAGSALSAEAKATIPRRFGAKLFELYGLTEGVATVLRPEEMADNLGSVGRPLMGTDIRIIDDTGRELARGEIGEIVGHSAGLMRGYHQQPAQTADALWRDPSGRQYLKTGDVGRLDADGFLYLLDRKKDMIVSGGLNVFAADLEAVLRQHPEVADAAVIAVPDDKWGETPLALVIRRPDGSAPPLAIQEWANARLAKHQRLAGVEFRERFPRNALGKVLKRELRRDYWKTEK